MRTNLAPELIYYSHPSAVFDSFLSTRRASNHLPSPHSRYFAPLPHTWSLPSPKCGARRNNSVASARVPHCLIRWRTCGQLPALSFRTCCTVAAAQLSPRCRGFLVQHQNINLPESDGVRNILHRPPQALEYQAHRHSLLHIQCLNKAFYSSHLHPLASPNRSDNRVVHPLQSCVSLCWRRITRW